MRLIDADALKSCYTGSNGLDDKASYESIRKMIDSQPTAYDVEKVVDDLKDHAIEFEAFGQCSDYVELSHAIEIVKGGGADV